LPICRRRWTDGGILTLLLQDRVAGLQVVPPHLARLATGPESDPLNPLLRNVGENSLKGRARSHLPVTKRFYPKVYAQLVAQAGSEKRLLAA